MAERLVPALIVLVVLAGILLLMWWAWRARKKRDASLVVETLAADAVVTPVIAVPALYVATTRTGEPLERLAITGLEYRARVELTVAKEGIVLAVPGTGRRFIRAEDIESAGPATWAIDRVVERDGMIAVCWNIGETSVDSYLRIIDQVSPGPILDAIASIRPGAAAPAAQNESEK